MSAIPERSRLEADLDQSFIFNLGDGRIARARLIAVPSGIPMDDDYECYSAVFEFEPGLQLQQDVYHITSPAGESWDLLATPHRPGAGGAARLGVVIHCLRPPLQRA